MFIPKKIMAVIKAAARDMTRYAINGVHLVRLSESRCQATATDGHRLIQITWGETVTKKMAWAGKDLEGVKGFSTLIPTKLWASARSLFSTSEGGGFVLNENETSKTKVSFVGKPSNSERIQIQGTTLEGAFPPVDTVIPKHEIIKGESGKAVMIGVNGQYMAECLSVLASLASDGTKVVLEIPTNPNKQILMRAIGPDCEAIAVLMPISLGTQS